MTRETLFQTLFPSLSETVDRLAVEHVPTLRRFGAEPQAAAVERVVAEFEAALRDDEERDLPVAEVSELVGMDKVLLHTIVAENPLEPVNGEGGARRVRVLDAVAYRLKPRTGSRSSAVAARRPQGRDLVITREVTADE